MDDGRRAWMLGGEVGEWSSGENVVRGKFLESTLCVGVLALTAFSDQIALVPDR